MKVKEKFTANSYDKFPDPTGLFSQISEVYLGNGFLPLFDLWQPWYLDMFYISNYGERTLSAFGENNDIKNIAQILGRMYFNKWKTLYEMLIADIDIDYNYTETQVENVKDKGGNTGEITSTVTDLVNAYNDDDFVNDKQNENKSQNKAENENLRNRDFTKKILQGGKTENFQKIILYLQNNFIPVIMDDVNQFLTLSIFD